MKLVSAIVVGMLVSIACAQDDSQLTPRELFYIKAPATPPNGTPKKTTSNTTSSTTSSAKVKPPEPPSKTPDVVTPEVVSTNNKSNNASTNYQKAADNSPSIVHVSYSPLALKYVIQQRKGDTYEEVDSDTEFHSGDHIRVRAESNATAYLYIVMGGSSGQWQVLFPSKDIDNGNNRIEAGQPRTIPFYFDENAGVEKLSLVLTRSPEPDLEKLIYAAGDPTRTDGALHHKTIIADNRPIDGAVVGQLRNEVLSRDLVFEKCDGTTPGCDHDKAVYAATKDKSADARLFVDLKLVHK